MNDWRLLKWSFTTVVHLAGRPYPPGGDWIAECGEICHTQVAEKLLNPDMVRRCKRCALGSDT